MDGPRSTAHRLTAAAAAASRVDDICGEIPASVDLSRELISTIVEHVASGWTLHSMDDAADEDEDEGYVGGPQPHDHYCDVCGMDPIVGIRYRSTMRRNYDVCEVCHAELPEEEKRDEYRAYYIDIQPTVLPTREEKHRAQAETREKVALECPNVSKAASLVATRRDLKCAALLGRAWRDEAMPLLADNKEAHKRAKIAAYQEIAKLQQRLVVESMQQSLLRLK